MSQRLLNSYYVVIWCGGDGTGHQIMNGFGQRDTCDVDSIRLATLGGGGGCSFLLNQSMESNLARQVTEINTVWCIIRGKYKQINLFAYNLDNVQTIYSWHMLSCGYWADICRERLESRSSGFAEYARLMKYYLENPNAITATIWAINNKDDHIGDWDEPISEKYKVCDKEKIYMFWLAKWPYFVSEFLEKAKTTIGEESGYAYLNKAEYAEGKWKGKGKERLAKYCTSMKNGDMVKRDACELSEIWEIRIELDKPEKIIIDGEIYTTQKVQGSSSGKMGVFVLC
jgi:diacylglycerol kinase family enzyme